MCIEVVKHVLSKRSVTVDQQSSGPYSSRFPQDVKQDVKQVVLYNGSECPSSLCGMLALAVAFRMNFSAYATLFAFSVSLWTGSRAQSDLASHL